MMTRFRLFTAALLGASLACLATAGNALVPRLSEPPLILQRDTYSGQTKGCAVSLHCRFTRVLWAPRWASHRDSALVSLFVAAPKQTSDGGEYRLKKWGVKFHPKRKAMPKGRVA